MYAIAFYSFLKARLSVRLQTTLSYIRHDNGAVMDFIIINIYNTETGIITDREPASL